MSIESAEAFFEKVQNDEDLMTKLSDKNLSGKERLNIAKAEGFEFTAQEMANVREELSEEMLEGISAGGGNAGLPACWFIHPPQNG
ncbi:MAG: Nif11-like leader peptide family natural product precursor [Deltaproteobacteria bacterium]|nr:Nif11-like leader peptide family natural product precursor [Deltaproteobacteria bacterium]